MKNLLLLIPFSLLFVQCQKENVADIAPQNLTLEISNELGEAYTPNEIFDQATKGIYHGVIVAQSGTNRGKIWISLDNNNRYTAKVEMHDGQKLFFEPSTPVEKNPHTIQFVSKDDSFTVTISDKEVAFIDAQIADEAFYIYAPKQTTYRMVFPFAGTYTTDVEPGKPEFSGTWTIFRDESFPDPNGVAFGGYAMADVVVTIGGNMYTDSNHTTGFYPCEGANNWVPVIRNKQFGGNQNPIFIKEMFVLQQASNFGGNTNWQIFQAGGIGYFDENCNDLTSGIFDWTSAANGQTRTGKIYLDDIVNDNM